MIPLKQREFINKYLAGRSIVFYNLSGVVRIQLKNFLASLGSGVSGVVEAQNISTFRDVFKSTTKVLLIVEEEPEPGKWEELMAYIHAMDVDARPATLFIMDKYKKSTVVKMGQDDIEGVVTKPLNQNKIANQLISTVKTWKVKKGYLRFIIEGRDFLQMLQFEQAEKAFISSIEHHPRPALSYQLLGSTYYAKGDSKRALENYFKALELNSSHYPSLYGLYILFKETGFSNEAYQIIRKIFSFYPAGPDELCDALRLAIETNGFEDIRKLHEIFIEVEDKELKLNKYMAAALYILSKHYLNVDNPEEAYKVGNMIRPIKVETKKFFFNLIKHVKEVSNKENVVKFMGLYASDDHNSNEYMMSQFYVSLYDVDQVSEHIDMGIEFINRGVEDENLFWEMIRLLEHVGNDKKAMVLRQKADKIWPEADFYTVVKK